MAIRVELPQLSDTMTEAVLVSWLVNEGDEVRVGDPVADVETDKAIMNIDAPASGTLLKQYAAEGDTVAVGALIAAIGQPGDPLPDPEEPPAEPVAEEPAPAAPPVTPSAPEPAAPTIPDSAQPDRIKASPKARKLAEENGVNLKDVAGTGPGGRIVKRDVLAGTAAKIPPGGKTVPITSRRKLMIRRLEEAARTIPTFTVSRDISMDAARSFRESLKTTRTFADGIGYNEIIMKAAARAMEEVPEMNASYVPEGIRFNDAVHMGMAVGLEDVVAVPVVRDCQTRSLAEISAEVRRLTEAARTGTLLAYDLGTSTFTISNLGMYGVDRFTAVLNPPEAAILAVGAVKRRPVVKPDAMTSGTSDMLTVGYEMSVTLTVDHRVADGMHAARWLSRFAGCMEDPVTLLVD